MKDVEIYLSYTTDVPLWCIYLILLSLIFFFSSCVLNIVRYKESKNKLEEQEEKYDREVRRKEKIIVDYQRELRELRSIATRPNTLTNSTVGNKAEKPRGNNGRFKAKG